MYSQLPFTYGVLSIICNLKIRHAVMTARMVGRRGAYRFVVGKPEGKKHLEDPGVEGRIVLNESSQGL